MTSTCDETAPGALDAFGSRAAPSPSIAGLDAFYDKIDFCLLKYENPYLSNRKIVKKLQLQKLNYNN